ncbi:MAG: malate dehydrogenase [Deltaproteobacteria bacterium GWC2_42_11]|nr:MAG: malate dehydrogenase [Deltaproteobacteria bacterium GWC2_42_11]HBO84229.1 malate dehydrogenase [Deltaproteobacteria bacterium]
MSRKKITIVGAGNVGAHAAVWAAIKELGDIVLIDVIEGVPQGKGLDLAEASPVEGFDARILGTNDYKDTANSDVVIITAGIARKPGMSRSDLINTNTGIIKGVTEQIVRYSPNAIIIVVTNPLDVMVYVAWKVSGFPKNRVIGLSGALDAARLKAFLSMELNVSVEDISAMVIGGHADEMVPLPRYSTVSGIPISQLISKERINEIMQRTKKAGGEIVDLLKTGSAFYAPSAAVVEMAESIIRDKKRIIPCAAYCNGEYGVKDMFIGVPVKLGSNGVEEIIEIELNEEEKRAFDNSAQAIKKLIEEIKI